MKGISILENILEKTVSAVITIMMSVMVVNIGLAVFFRYVLRSSLHWSEELARYLMVWVAYLGSSLGMKEDSHIGLEFFVRWFPASIQRIFHLLVRLVMEAFLVIIFFESFTHLKTLTIQRSSAMEIPMIFPYISVTVGMFLMFVFNSLHILKNYLSRVSNKK